MSEQAYADCKVQNWKIGRKTERMGEKESKKEKKGGGMRSERKKKEKEKPLYLFYMPSLGTLKTIKGDSSSLARELDII